MHHAASIGDPFASRRRSPASSLTGNISRAESSGAVLKLEDVLDGVADKGSEQDVLLGGAESAAGFLKEKQQSSKEGSGFCGGLFSKLFNTRLPSLLCLCALLLLGVITYVSKHASSGAGDQLEVSQVEEGFVTVLGTKVCLHTLFLW